MDFYIYILASKPRGTLYIGVTRDIEKRIYQHKTKEIKGFTTKYNVMMLVYYENFDSPYEAIGREKQLKHWNRAWKMRLIEEQNPQWEDLSVTWFGSSPTRLRQGFVVAEYSAAP